MVVKFNHLLPAMPELGMGLPNAYNKGPPGNGTFSRSADSDLNDADTTKLWQGLLTLPLGRPNVSNRPAGDLRSSRRLGLETRAEPPT
jgi:hypothetical protein